MKINISGLNKDLKDIIIELSEILKFDLQDDGIKLTAKKADTGVEFSLEKADGRYEITYNSLPSFCRALSYIHKNKSVKQASKFDTLAVMLDMSRNGVMTVLAIKKYVRRIALQGFSELQLYLEDTYEVKNEPYFGQFRGRYTREEISEVKKYCQKFGIELTPCIQTLAHLSAPFKWWRYAENIVDCADILLVGESKTYEFLENCISSVVEMFGCKKINIGMDEAFMLGRGRYKTINGEVSQAKIFNEHLRRVNEICLKFGLEVSIWSDMLFKLAYGEGYGVNCSLIESIDIPANVTPIYWEYENTDEATYDNVIKKHLQMCNKLSFAGALKGYSGIIPNNDKALELAVPCINALVKNGVKELIVANWGDDGMECSRYSVAPSLLVWSELVWGQDLLLDFDLIIDERLQSCYNLNLSDMNLLTQAYKFTPKTPYNTAIKYLLYNDPLLGKFDSLTHDGYARHYAEIAKKLAKPAQNIEFGYLFKALEKNCEVLKNKCDLGVRIKKAYDEKDIVELKKIADEIPTIINNTQEFICALKEQWLKEHKIFGFETIEIRLGALTQRLYSCRQTLLNYAYGKTAIIAEMEEPRLNFTGKSEDSVTSADTSMPTWYFMPTVGVL